MQPASEFLNCSLQKWGRPIFRLKNDVSIIKKMTTQLLISVEYSSVVKNGAVFSRNFDVKTGLSVLLDITTN